ncbi:sister chromatid cohesion protein-like protein Mis4 [Plenodomus tracheiphilus IPT5]|uniref:Sister chromatid cohesion protein n=1 Tax=Plenodomus tracheiphilus IPT5 TaxID=1408161 RepID=A0A6A7BKJ6_9PLEO|nr:sister chromatid cohesion protein-like protein Mis4 [Plenodomus tracheiphilus IPT5]
MADTQNGSWHHANGGGLPYRRPPTADEALPYSPFTSIIPFSPDIIPFPSAEPPTPPSTLTPSQRSDAKKAVSILNDEIRGQSTAQHLHDTLQQLRDLLHRDNLPEYIFKPMPQTATPPPDSPPHGANGSASKYHPSLSPFASMLLRQTDVSFTSFDARASEQPRKVQTSVKHPSPAPQARAGSQPQPATPNSKASLQDASIPFPSSALSSAPSSTPAQSVGPAVVIKPKSVQRGDYTRYDTISTSDSLSQKKQDDRGSDATALRPQEREIADRKSEDLANLVASLEDDRDDVDGSQRFIAIDTPEGDFKVLDDRSMESLTSQVSNVVNFGRLSTLPVDFVMRIQSLAQPTVVSTVKNGLFLQDDGAFELSESMRTAEGSLKAARLILDTMIEGRDDYRLRREETIDVIIELLKLIKDTCITPIIQARKSGETEVLFSTAWANKKELQAILRLCGSLLSRFSILVGKYNLPDRARNTLEYLTLDLLVEQNSDSDRDSVFGITRFERFRQRAMDVLAQIFAQHAEQRQSILNGIMSNLEKLPHKKASARQFQSVHEVPIMTISASFMRFVHVSATNRQSSAPIAAASEAQETHDDETSDYEPGTASKRSHKRNAAVQTAKDLVVNARQIAGHIVMSLVARAKGVSKTGDKPFRNLLDLFVDDFCNVFGSPEWPAAGLLLHSLLGQMQSLLQGSQSSVNDKDMALATMARIGCGIIDFKHALRESKRKLDISQSNLSSRLDHLVDDAINEDARERVNDVDLLAFDGPYRMVIESLGDYLDLKTSPDDPHLRSVSGCHVSSWLSAVIQAFPPQDQDERPQVIKDLQSNLESIIVDSKWLARRYNFEPVSNIQSKLAAGIITLQSPVCRYLPHIVSHMVICTRDKDFPRLRTKGFTGLEQLIEKDPRVVDENTVLGMIPSLTDTSPSVRDSTLKLIARCVELDPSLERHVLLPVLARTADDKPAPRKRAIKLAKDIYLGPTAKANKLKIAAALLPPSQDPEKTISELSRNILEEIWFTTAIAHATTDDSKVKLHRVDRAYFMVDIIAHLRGLSSTANLEAFEQFLVYVLSPESRNPTANMQLCKELVTDLLDEIISPESQFKKDSQARIMHALSLFAKAEATLFTTEQIQLLKLYIADATSTEEINLVQPTVIILRHTLPTLPVTQHAFAEDVRTKLLSNITKFAKNANRYAEMRSTLDDVVHCLWTISTMPGLGVEKIATVVASVLCQLRPLQTYNKEQDVALGNRISTYLILLATFGKVCNFSQYEDTFWGKVNFEARKQIRIKAFTEKQMEPFLKARTRPSLLLLETVRPFTMQCWDCTIRENALWSLGGICQQSPEHFRRAEVEKVIKLVFVNEDTDNLKRIALSSLNDYFTFAERRSETGAQIAIGKGAATGAARLETSFDANENDTATIQLAHTFLPNFVDVALKVNNGLAELATSLVASISRQGLVHPKECGAALVALATSKNKRIAEMAAKEHKRIHEKQESYLEKEYMQAIRMTFKYQRDVFNDSHGMLEASYSAKLVNLFDALKASAKATFKKFVVNFCKQVDFDFSKLDASGTMPEPLLFARFCLENIALLDFQSMDVLAVFLNAIEAIVFKTTGPVVALAIETEMPKQLIFLQQPMIHDTYNQQMLEASGFPMAAMSLPDPTHPSSQLAPPAIDQFRLRQITVACMILQMIWETRNFVRRCYNLQKLIGRIPQKDYIKEAKRNNLVSSKELWERLSTVMSALDTHDTMIKQCYDFADLLEVDREARVGDDDLDDMGLGGGYETPGEADDDDSVPVPTSGRGKKRKGSASLHNTPKKARGRSSGAKNKKRGSRTPGGDEDSD